MGPMQLFNKPLKQPYIVPRFKLSIYSVAYKLKPTPYVQYDNKHVQIFYSLGNDHIHAAEMHIDIIYLSLYEKFYYSISGA